MDNGIDSIRGSMFVQKGGEGCEIVFLRDRRSSWILALQ